MHAACCVTRVIICINQIETFRTTEYLHTVHSRGMYASLVSSCDASDQLEDRL